MPHFVRCAPTRAVRSTTPRAPYSPVVRELCRRLAPAGALVPLPFRLLDCRYEAGRCHANVLHRVREAGGERVFGWLLWEQRGVIAEGEFHSVWRAPSGELVDITPRVDGERRVAFLPDTFRRLERVGDYDVSWANYSNWHLSAQPETRFLVQRDRALEDHLERLGFARQEQIA